MSIQVSITKGFYRGTLISGIFPLVKSYVEGARGGYVTIKNPAPKEGTPPVQRITVDLCDFKLLDSNGLELGEHVVVTDNTGSAGVAVSTNYEQAFIEAESDEEAMARIEETFLMLDKITDACSRGVIRGLVVSGPPGVGKSFGVEKQLETANMLRKMEGQDPLYEVISGGISSIGLYQKLYYNRSPKQVLVFDDCDGALLDEECLTLLKAALNSGDKRRINWNKESRVLAVEDIPESFDFEASIVFLSNIDFEKTIEKGSRLAAHLAAIMSRCHYMDLEIGSMRDKLLRIKQICRDGMLKPFDFDINTEKEIVDFIINNAEYLREVSLRVVKKVADLAKADPDNWKDMAEATILTRDAKFKRLIDKRTKDLVLQSV